jgi:sugar lactone lactonase YvrE
MKFTALLLVSLLLFAPVAPAAPCRLCLYGPDNMAFDAAGNVYLVDTDHKSRSRVLKLSPNGRVLADWRVFSAVPGRHNGPDGIALDNEENVFVINGGHDQVLKLSPKGEVLAELGGFTSGAFDEGGHVAVGKDGNIYVVAAGSNLIQQYSPPGKLISSWHRNKGIGIDQWIQPETISVADDGNLVIDDWGNHRILTLSPTGQTIRAFEAIPNEPLKLASTSGAVVAPNGNIYVADFQLYRVQEFDSRGHLLATIGNTPGNTLFELAPNSVAVDQSGNLYSADGLSVVKYSREGKLLARWR